MNATDLELLVTAARGAQRMAYAPYSEFRVGAALLCSAKNGERVVVTGCNVENAAYPASICAERVAVGSALARGLRDIHAVVVATDALEPSSPCGVCRQVLAELAPGAEVAAVAGDGRITQWTLSELLPHAFARESLARG